MGVEAGEQGGYVQTLHEECRQWLAARNVLPLNVDPQVLHPYHQTPQGVYMGTAQVPLNLAPFPAPGPSQIAAHQYETRQAGRSQPTDFSGTYYPGGGFPPEFQE